MELSFRLNKIASKVIENGVLADIGTDHAYIPIFLYKNNKISGAIACDVSRGPLENAKENILRYNLQNNIDVRLGNGLEKVTLQDNVNTIIIAGMGGKLIIDILDKGEQVAKNANTLILQPQKDVDKVRKYLNHNGYYIEDDEMILENDRFYTIIVAKNGNEEIEYTEQEYNFGRFEINQKSEILKEYIKEELYRMDRVLKNIKDIDDKSRIFEVEERYKMHKEVLECL